jgi:Dna[CI] antecedent, DciA
MTDKSPRSLAEVLATGRLGALGREAEQRRTTTERIRLLLPPDEAEHLVTASTNPAGELVLVMDSAVWAARVRYRGEELGVARLWVRVLPTG